MTCIGFMAIVDHTYLLKRKDIHMNIWSYLGEMCKPKCIYGIGMQNFGFTYKNVCIVYNKKGVSCILRLG